MIKNENRKGFRELLASPSAGCELCEQKQKERYGDVTLLEDGRAEMGVLSETFLKSWLRRTCKSRMAVWRRVSA